MATAPRPPRFARLFAPPTLGWLAMAVALLGLVTWAWPRPPRNHWREVARARAYLNHGRYDKALEAVSHIRDELPGAGEAMAIAGEALIYFGQLTPARRSLERALQLQERQPMAAKMLGAIYLASGNAAGGIRLLKLAAEHDPDDFRPWLALGKVYHDLGNLDLACDAYANALARKPPTAELRETRLGAIKALLDDSRAEEAGPLVEAALSDQPEDPQVLALAARQARDLGRSAPALELAERALARDPACFEALLVRAKIANIQGRPEQALADVEAATAVNPNHLGALQLRAQIEARLGLAERAAETNARHHAAQYRLTQMDRLTREIERRPEDPEPRYRMGQIALEGELPVLAYQCFRAALDLDPNYRPALEGIQALGKGQAPPGLQARANAPPALMAPGASLGRDTNRP